MSVTAASGEWIGMTDRARLLQLFDAAEQVASDVALWERDEPDAPTALVLWACDHHRQATKRGGEFPVLEVRTTGHRSICVYLRGGEAG